MQAPAAETEHIQAPGAREESEEKPPRSTAEDNDKQLGDASTEMKSPSLPQPTTSCTIFAHEYLPPLTAEEAASIVINENEYKSAPSSLGETWRLPRDPRRLITSISYHMEASNLPCEDLLLIEPVLGPGQGGLYAVIDGHGGVTSAEHITHLLPVEYRKLLDAGVPPGKALVDALAEVEKIIISMSRKDHKIYTSGACLIAAALAEHRPQGPRTVAEELRVMDRPELEMWEAPLVVANIGDSRAVLGVLFEGEVLPYEMSKKHNTTNTVEVLQLQASHPLGMGVVSNPSDPDDPRVLGISQVTRSIGDAYLKGLQMDSEEQEDEEGVHRRKKRKPMKTSSPLDVLSSTPYVDSMTDELRDCYYAPAVFLVLGSDGLYDHLSCGEICTFIQEHVKAGKSRETVAQALCQAAFKRAAFKLNEQKCTSEWLANFKPGDIDEWKRTRREVVDDTTAIILFFR